LGAERCLFLWEGIMKWGILRDIEEKEIIESQIDELDYCVYDTTICGHNCKGCKYGIEEA
jgi:hypothetical protein